MPLGQAGDILLFFLSTLRKFLKVLPSITCISVLSFAFEKRVLTFTIFLWYIHPRGLSAFVHTTSVYQRTKKKEEEKIISLTKPDFCCNLGVGRKCLKIEIKTKPHVWENSGIT